MKYALLLLLLAPLVFAQSGSIQPTEQYYRFDVNKDPLCTSSTSTDCVRGVRFFYFLAGVRVGVVDVPFSSLVVTSGVAEAKTPLPTISSRYAKDFQLYAATVAVDENGLEVESVPLALSYAKRPAQGVKFDVR